MLKEALLLSAGKTALDAAAREVGRAAGQRLVKNGAAVEQVLHQWAAEHPRSSRLLWGAMGPPGPKNKPKPKPKAKAKAKGKVAKPAVARKGGRR